MVIIGTGGIAKDMIGSMTRDLRNSKFYFYNDKIKDTDTLFFNKFPIMKTKEALIEHFKTHENGFVTAIANPLVRHRMNNKITELGGVMTNVIAKKGCIVSEFAMLSNGIIIQPGSIISGNVFLGEGVFVNSGVIIGHDAKIEKYCSFGPGVRVLGGVSIGEYSYIGCNAVIMPGVKIGNKVRIGIGKIIDKDVPDNSKII
jgi:sugar O-acyltransferase (sialic acid O-acetyltransferase NeuD family)